VVRSHHSSRSLHQPSGTASGQAEDIRIQADEITRLRERINKVLAERTKQPLERIAEDTDRDYILDADQACDYGVVDHVITRRPPIGCGVQKLGASCRDVVFVDEAAE
jgi:ATP-dependent Clp protease protease subunit